MEQILLSIVWLASVLAIGWSVLKIIIARHDLGSLIETAALSYGLGLGVISLQMAILALIGINFSMASTLIIFIPAFVMALFLQRKYLRKKDAKKVSGRQDRSKVSFLEKFFIASILFEVSYAFFRALIKPMESYDSIAIWAFKAKIFYLAKTIPAGFFKDFSGMVPHIEYPLLIPLAQASFYAFLGALNDLAVKIIFPLYYAALIALLYSILRRFLEKKASLLFTFLLATIPQVTDFATNGYADMPLAFYCSASFFYLYLWLIDKKPHFIALSFALSSMAVWTKAEGILFAIANSIVAIYFMVKWKRFSLKGVLYTASLLAVVIVYISVLKSIGLAINTDFISEQSSLIARINTGLGRIPAILYEYQIQFFGPKKWNILWILFIAGFIFGFKKIFSKELMPVTLAAIVIIAGYSLVYMLSSARQGFGWHLSTSCSRLFIHFAPIIIFWLALIYKELKLEI